MNKDCRVEAKTRFFYAPVSLLIELLSFQKLIFQAKDL